MVEVFLSLVMLMYSLSHDALLVVFGLSVTAFHWYCWVCVLFCYEECSFWCLRISLCACTLHLHVT